MKRQCRSVIVVLVIVFHGCKPAEYDSRATVLDSIGFHSREFFTLSSEFGISNGSTFAYENDTMLIRHLALSNQFVKEFVKRHHEISTLKRLNDVDSVVEAYKLTAGIGSNRPEKKYVATIIKSRSSYSFECAVFDERSLVKSYSVPVDSIKWHAFKTLLNGSYFWELGSFERESRHHIDTTYVLEGLKKTKRYLEAPFHFVKRNNPAEGSFKAACKYLIATCDLEGEIIGVSESK